MRVFIAYANIMKLVPLVTVCCITVLFGRLRFMEALRRAGAVGELILGAHEELCAVCLQVQGVEGVAGEKAV